MTNKMTENILKSLSSPESFTRGHDLYQSDAVFDTFRQGDLLTGKCKGSMVKSTVNEITTYYIGGYYELKVVGSTETETKYYTGPTGRSAKALLCNAFAEFERSSNSMRAAAIQHPRPQRGGLYRQSHGLHCLRRSARRNRHQIVRIRSRTDPGRIHGEIWLLKQVHFNGPTFVGKNKIHYPIIEHMF